MCFGNNAIFFINYSKKRMMITFAQKNEKKESIFWKKKNREKKLLLAFENFFNQLLEHKKYVR